MKHSFFFRILCLLTILLSLIDNILSMDPPKTILPNVLTKGQQLIEAAKKGDLDLIKQLNCPAKDIQPLRQRKVRSNKINPNHLDSDGGTALMFASSKDHLEVVRYLIEDMGIKVSLMDKSGWTALQVAACRESINTLTYLMGRSDFQKTDGAIALARAYNQKSTKIVAALEKYVGILPAAGDLTNMKNIFYSEQANSKLNLTLFEPLVHFEHDNHLLCQVKVMNQAGEECSRVQLNELTKKLGEPCELHYAANPIFGGTCSYHALKNGLLGLMMLYDYDKLVEHSHKNDDAAYSSIIEWLNSDIESLVSLASKNFSSEHFMESIHAKVFMLKDLDFQLNSQAAIGLNKEKFYIAQHTFDDYFGTIISHRHQIPLYESDNRLSFCDVYDINRVISHGFLNNSSYKDPSHWDSSGVPTQEHPCANAETLYQNPLNNSLSNGFGHIGLLNQIGSFDLLQQIALFRSNEHYRHAFVICINANSNDGFGMLDHALTVILDKRNATINKIIFESNNNPQLALKNIVEEFFSLFTDTKKYPMNDAYASYLVDCASHRPGITIESPQKGLPSFESLVNSYVQIHERCITTKDRDDAHYALFLFSKIKHYYDRAKIRAKDSNDTKTLHVIETILVSNGIKPEDILPIKSDLPSCTELYLYDLINKIEDHQLAEKIHSFAQDGDVSKVEKLLKLGVNPNTKDSDGKTALMHAVGRDNMVAFLHMHGADIESTDNEGNTPLMHAAKCGCLPTVKYLIIHGAQVNKQNNAGCTALMATATYIPNEAVVRFLIEEGKAHFTLKDRAGSTLLTHSASRQAIGILRYLIAEKNMPFDLETLVTCAMESFNNHPLIDYLIKDHGLTSKNHNDLVIKLLIDAAKKGNTKIIKRLIEKDCGISINAQDDNGYTAFMHAVDKGYHQLIEDLLNIENIDIHIKNNNGKTALDIAYEKGFEHIVKVLGGNVSKIVRNPISTSRPFYSHNPMK